MSVASHQQTTLAASGQQERPAFAPTSIETATIVANGNNGGSMIVSHVYQTGQRILARLLSLTIDGNPLSLHSLMTILTFIGVKVTPQHKAIWQRLWNWDWPGFDDREFLGGLLVILVALLLSMGLNLATTLIMLRE